jgi:transcriptional regulator with XRE-family HTH domain
MPARPVAHVRREPDLGEQLRELIRRSGKSASEVARMAEVDPAQVIRFLSGTRDIRLETAGFIARALGLQLVEAGRGRNRPAARKSERAESPEMPANPPLADDPGPVE